MSKNYLKNLLHYIDSVYSIREKINTLKDGRKNKRVPTPAVAFVVLFGFMLKIRSFNQLDDWLEHKDFKNIVPKKLRLPRIDAVRDSLKVFCLKTLHNIYNSIIREARNNKLFRNGTIDGYKVVALDGVALFDSTKKSCKNCLTKNINGTIHYYHHAVIAAYIGQDPCITLGAELLTPQKDNPDKDEHELTGAKRLLDKLYKTHHHYADVVVYDALACNAPWINTVKQYGMDAVVRVKREDLNIVKDALGLFNTRNSDESWEYKKTNNRKVVISAWHNEVEMTGVKGTVRFAQFIEQLINVETGEIVDTKRVWIITTAKHIELKTLCKMIHARWNIENNVFRQLKTQWHMDHCFVHNEIAIEATLMFMLTAFNLMQLYFFRRLRGFREKKLLQVEVIERIIKQMIAYDAKGKYILDTS